MDAKIEKTMEDKLRELGIPENTWNTFSKGSVDAVYTRFYYETAIKTKEEVGFMYFLNEILSLFGKEYIKIPEEFRLERSDALKIDGEKFVTDHKDKLQNHGISPTNHLGFAYRNYNKSYGITVLKGIANFFNYDVIAKTKANNVSSKKTYTRIYKLSRIQEDDDL